MHKAGKIRDLCEGEGVFTRLTALERQFPSASVLVHKQGVLPPEIAALWASPQLMSAAHQFLGGEAAGLACFMRFPRQKALSMQVPACTGWPGAMQHAMPMQGMGSPGPELQS